LFWYSLKRDLTVQAKWLPVYIGNIGNGVADNNLPRPGLKQSLVGPKLAFAFLQELQNNLPSTAGTGTIKKY
jgi:hypothetical protein